jgi:diamine N-acetyltransferase
MGKIEPSRNSVSAIDLALRQAGADDIPAVMRIERTPGFELCVGRSDEAEHREMLASAAFAYRLGIGAGGDVEAFAILRGLGDPHRNLYLKRIAVVRPGEGFGTAFLARLLDEAFASLGAERLYLDCFADNFRAQSSYAKLGFSRDGVLRKAYRATDGTRKDLVLMALLRDEWAAGQTSPGAAPSVGAASARRQARRSP